MRRVRQARIADGEGDRMSSLYEQWKPAVGDRVRIVERNEMGAATQTGESGTVVGLHPDQPEALCEVRYDAGAAGASGPQTRRHAAAELEPIGTKAGDVEPWEPTVGDRVMTPGGREATVTAIEDRPDGTVCEVEYNHRPGEQAEPMRGMHPLRDLTPTKEPSAEAVEGSARASTVREAR
jgi:hypothetical protein